jgi:CRP-like cAMP-binding protein
MLRMSHESELADIPVFQAYRDPALRRIERCLERRSFQAGEVVIAEGAPGYDVFVITAGQAVVSRCGGVVATLGVGDWFGELAVLLDLPRNATVRAMTPLQVFAVPGRDFVRLLEAVPDLWRRMGAIMARRLRQADLAS